MPSRRVSDGLPARRWLATATLAASVGVSGVYASECQVGALQAPAGYYQIPELRKNAGDYDCDTVAPHVGSLSFTSKYEGSDSARNELNEEALAAYKEASEKIRTFEKTVVAAADDYQVDGDGTAARDCVMDNLDQWASAGALLHEEVNHVGEAVRKWALAASANAYLRVKSAAPEGSLDPGQSERIEAWFRQLVDGVRNYYTDRPLRKVNNHDYWAAFAVISAAVATGDCDDWGWALAKFDEAMGQITEEGYLPKELSREDRALEYLNYAMQPLTLIAVFAEVNGESVYERYREKFRKLTGNVVAGLESPGRIAAVTGYEQITDGLYTAWGLAWMEPWQKTWGPIAGMPEFLEKHRPMKSTRLGGDISYLYRIDPTWSVGTQPLPPGDIQLRDFSG